MREPEGNGRRRDALLVFLAFLVVGVVFLSAFLLTLAYWVAD